MPCRRQSFVFFIFLVLLSNLFGGLALAQGVCYSRTDHQPQPLATPLSRKVHIFERNWRHGAALLASQASYLLADLEKQKTGTDFLSNHAEFYRQIPSGYRVMHAMSYRKTGFKYVILEPVDLDQPWIFAVTGTNSLIDILSDVSLGRAQLQSIIGLLTIFTDCESTDGYGQPIGSRDWIITGHSLGGGMAQAIAYEIQKKRLELGLVPGLIELVTFNAFGAAELVDLNWQSDILPTIHTANYFVTGDPVSKIGTHLGLTYELPVTRGVLNVMLNPLEKGRRHSLDTVQGLVLAGERFDFLGAPMKSAPYSGVLNRLKILGGALSFLPEIAEERTRFTAVETLEQATDMLVARRFSETYDREARQYISNMAMMFLADAQSRPKTPLNGAIQFRLSELQDRLLKPTE